MSPNQKKQTLPNHTKTIPSFLSFICQFCFLPLSLIPPANTSSPTQPPSKPQSHPQLSPSQLTPTPLPGQTPTTNRPSACSDRQVWEGPRWMEMGYRRWNGVSDWRESKWRNWRTCCTGGEEVTPGRGGRIPCDVSTHIEYDFQGHMILVCRPDWFTSTSRMKYDDTCLGQWLPAHGLGSYTFSERRYIPSASTLRASERMVTRFEEGRLYIQARFLSSLRWSRHPNHFAPSLTMPDVTILAIRYPTLPRKQRIQYPYDFVRIIEN